MEHYKGKNFHDWDKELGFQKGTTRARIKNFGWSWEKATNTPKTTYKEYSYDKKRKQYVVNIKRNGKQCFVGRYETPEDALQARKDWLDNYRR